jgi:hypothetical protein
MPYSIKTQKNNIVIIIAVRTSNFPDVIESHCIFVMEFAYGEHRHAWIFGVH